MTAVTTIGSYEDDQDFRIRSLQNTGVNFTPVASIMAPQGPSSVSSIAPAEKKEVPQHRPQLAAPSYFMPELIDLQLNAEQLNAKDVRVTGADIQKCLAENERLSAEKDEVLKEEAQKAAHSQSTWNTLSVIAQYITNMSLLVAGTSLGGVPAFLLVGSGVVGLGNRVAHDTNFLQAAVAWWTQSAELQKKYTQKIEMAAFFLQMGMGLAGGVWAVQAGALAAARTATALDVTRKASTIITSASTVAGAGTKVGADFYKKRVTDIEAAQNEITGQITTNSQTITQGSQQMSRGIESTSTQNEGLRRAVQALEVSVD